MRLSLFLHKVQDGAPHANIDMMQIPVKKRGRLKSEEPPGERFRRGGQVLRRVGLLYEGRRARRR